MKRFKNILYVVTADEAGASALERAVTLAENNQAALTVVTVVEALPASGALRGLALTADAFQAAMVSEAKQRLDRLAAPWCGRVEIETRVLVGTLFLEVIREVLRNGRDLVVKCAGSSGLLGRLLGSEDMHLLRKCPCPIWLGKPNSPARYRCILAAVDVDEFCPPGELPTRRELNFRILELAASLALSEFAELHVVHVWSAVGETVMRGAFLTTPEEQIRAYVSAEKLRHTKALDDLLDEGGVRLGGGARGYLKPVKHLLKGCARDEIPALAGRLSADLVVLGTVARTGIPGFLMGNTAETLLHRLDCAVLALKPTGFVTPVSL